MQTKVNHERVKALLAENCLTQAEIARRVGCSRERIRQLCHKYQHETGRQREDICRINRMEFPEHPFVKSVLEKGFNVTISLGERGLPLKRSIFVNGKLCRMAATHRRHLYGNRNEYWHIRRPSVYADFYVWWMDDSSDCLIVPYEKAPSSQTTITVDRSLKLPGPYHIRHDWKDYLNAYHLLGETNANSSTSTGI